MRGFLKLFEKNPQPSALKIKQSVKCNRRTKTGSGGGVNTPKGGR